MTVLDVRDGEGSLEHAANRALMTSPPPARLPTRRQLEVLEVLSHGLTREEAAAQLGIGVESIKEHLKHARARLGARTTLHAIAEAIRRGLIP